MKKRLFTSKCVPKIAGITTFFFFQKELSERPVDGKSEVTIPWRNVNTVNSTLFIKQ